ncbi:uncharacterized protein EV420DRAFT_1645964 [Desarmillaria tabescens]|uniref:MYND-type domain-containing protein n=1 Tax=Armillaria tabescens TaxID=1929756 RepID=A0AA39MZP7_ARMTA|nr:uncharacterized protein EV420DRAFT_1645964 [Desarmillaria tabescens]KAK0452014.1 hypothetical protein EV420DRAFT_1645964 [Desarmillaria tabescens]
MSSREIGFPDGTSYKLDAIVDLFVQSLSDPSHPSHCVLFYTSSLISFWNLHTMADLRASRHDLLETCLLFLTTPRTPDEIRTLQSTMQTCSCPKDNPLVNRLHQYCHPDYFKRPFDRFRFTEVICMMSTMLLNCTFNAIDPKESKKSTLHHGIHKRALREEKQGKTPMWPVTPDEFYSAVGAETTVKMLWQWAYMYELVPSFLLLNGIITMAGTTLSVTVFIMPSFAPQLVEVINKSVDSLEKITSLADRDFSVLQQVERTVQMSTIEMICHGEGVRVRTYWKNHKEALLQALSRVVNITSGTPFYEELLTRVCIIHDTLGSFAIDEEHKKENDFWKAYTAIRQVTLSDRCHAPGCLETFTSTGRKFQNCSGCKRVSYCSEKCQKRAWKLGEAPHKIICPLVKDFSDRIQLQFKFADGEVLPPDVVERTCRKVGVDEMEAHTIRWYFELLDTLLVVRNPYDSRVGIGH